LLTIPGHCYYNTTLYIGIVLPPPPPSIDCRSALIYAQLLTLSLLRFSFVNPGLHLRLSSWVALSISCHLLFCGAAASDGGSVRRRLAFERSLIEAKPTTFTFAPSRPTDYTPVQATPPLRRRTSSSCPRSQPGLHSLSSSHPLIIPTFSRPRVPNNIR